MLKAAVLCLITTNSIFWMELYKSTLDDYNGQLLQVKRACAIFLVPDIVALFMVPKLPTTTLIHHVTTITSGFVIFSSNFKMKGFFGVLGFVKMGVFYGSFSSLAFPVNAYLGLRVVYHNSKWIKLLCYISLIVYVIVCFVNWIYHSVWLIGVIQAGDYSFFSVLYCIVFFLIVSDDIILIKWLLRKSSPMIDDKLVRKN